MFLRILRGLLTSVMSLYPKSIPSAFAPWLQDHPILSNAFSAIPARRFMIWRSCCSLSVASASFLAFIFAACAFAPPGTRVLPCNPSPGLGASKNENRLGKYCIPGFHKHAYVASTLIFSTCGKTKYDPPHFDTLM